MLPILLPKNKNVFIVYVSVKFILCIIIFVCVHVKEETQVGTVPGTA
jgi:hypothetical protein